MSHGRLPSYLPGNQLQLILFKFFLDLFQTTSSLFLMSPAQEIYIALHCFQFAFNVEIFKEQGFVPMETGLLCYHAWNTKRYVVSFEQAQGLRKSPFTFVIKTVLLVDKLVGEKNHICKFFYPY